MIALTDVTKEYRTGVLGTGGRVRALDGVTLEVAAGTALGLVGLNGAGKSTLLRILLGYARPTAGEVSIDGMAPRRYTERHGVAYVPESVTIPGGWTVRSALRAYAMLGNLGQDAWARVDDTLERLGLAPLADRRVRALSKGNLQRLGIAQAILGDRALMVLDEPTDGLDPVWIVELRAIVAEWRAAPGRTLVLASHNLPEVERLTDRAVLLHNGRLAGELGGGGALESRFLKRVHSMEEARA